MTAGTVCVSVTAGKPSKADNKNYRLDHIRTFRRETGNASLWAQFLDF